MDLTEIRQELYSMSEESYRIFTQKLIPNTTDILGVRLPALRKLASRIAKEEPITFLENMTPCCYEERMLTGFVIGKLKETDCTWNDISQYIQKFVPLIDNWSVCDSFTSSLKIAKKEPDRMYELIRPYSASDSVYEMRFYIVMCLNYMNQEKYLSDIMQQLEQILDRCQNTDAMYYVLMAIAWEYSMLYIGYPQMIIRRLEQLNDHKMNESKKFVFSKTISKIIDSRQISKKEKDKMRQLRSQMYV